MSETIIIGAAPYAPPVSRSAEYHAQDMARTAGRVEKLRDHLGRTAYEARFKPGQYIIPWVMLECRDRELWIRVANAVSNELEGR